MAILPIKPNQVKLARKIPEKVLEVVNEFIVKKFDGYSATLLQKDIVAELVKRGMNRDEIFDNHWLDFEDSYRKAGWEVVYDKPAYCETYDAYFLFKK